MNAATEEVPTKRTTGAWPWVLVVFLCLMMLLRFVMSTWPHTPSGALPGALGGPLIPGTQQPPIPRTGSIIGPRLPPQEKPAGFTPGSKSRKDELPLERTHKIAGLTGFVSRSTITYTVQPDRPHLFEATYVFPGRVRWWIGSQEMRMGERQILYRYGDAQFLVPFFDGRSQQYEGSAAGDLRRQMELRRAVMLWPDGFAWRGVGEERTASLGELGRLEARIGENGRPKAIACRTANDSLAEVLDDIVWRKAQVRHWPASMTLHAGGEPIWKETVDSIETDALFLDSYFLPPDRRRLSRVSVDNDVRAVDVPPRAIRRIELEMDLDAPLDPDGWARVTTICREQRDTWRKKLAAVGLELDARMGLELDSSGRPIAHYLRIAGRPPDPVPEGWSQHPAGAGLSIFVRGTAGITTPAIARLRGGLSKGDRPGAVYARLDPAPGDAAMIQLVQPLLPR